MSDKHDHHHHDHDHDHGHHDHDHDHSHPKPSAPEPEVDDPGSRALADALRSSFAIVKVVMLILLLVFIGSGFFKVGPQEKAIILRFGNPVGVGKQALLASGLHWAFPAPIDEVVRIPYSQLQQVRSDIGWYPITAEQEALNQDPDPTGRPSLNPAVDGYTITGDGNIVHARATLNYHIEDPVVYQFDFTSASKAIQNALDNAVVYAASRFNVDDILTRDKVRFKDIIQARVEQLIHKQNLGIVIDQCQVESRPPKYLKGAFDSVLIALTTRDKVIDEALSYSNQVISKAEANAASRTNNAEAQRVALVKSVRAEAQSFSDLLPHYQANPQLFTSVLLNESIARVLTNVQDKVYLPERADGKPRELRLQLSREPVRQPIVSPGPQPIQ